jgi:hypothetical protein
MRNARRRCESNPVSCVCACSTPEKLGQAQVPTWAPTCGGYTAQDVVLCVSEIMRGGIAMETRCWPTRCRRRLRSCHGKKERRKQLPSTLLRVLMTRLPSASTLGPASRGQVVKGSQELVPLEFVQFDSSTE